MLIEIVRVKDAVCVTGREEVMLGSWSEDFEPMREVVDSINVVKDAVLDRDWRELRSGSWDDDWGDKVWDELWDNVWDES